MRKIKIEIADKQYTVELAETLGQREIGLQGRKELEKNEGMLFLFDGEEDLEFWMKDTFIPLDIIFISEDLEVTSVEKGIPESEELMSGFGAYVLELNQNSGVKKGDELSFNPNKKQKKTDKMLVLNSSGESQMELDGGERIFSRAHTKTLIKFAKKAVSTERDNDYVALGKRMFKFLQVQSDTKPEYVESKNQN